MTARRPTFDLIVVGGGTAGCVVAARASEDPHRRVLLLEAGPDPQPVPDVISDPKRQGELIRDLRYVQRYEVERGDGSRFALVSGRVMGGGSSVNNLAVARPMRRDFEAWQRFGGDGWSYESLLPLMRAIEADPDFAASPIHGASGPLSLRRSFRLDGPADPPVRALLEAAHALGLPDCPDLNGPEPYGVCASPYNQRDGKRLSTAQAYLDPARGRPGLTIRAGTPATRLVMAGSRVRGVEVATPAGLEFIEGAQVVLAAGVFHSPRLLMLSGIGPVSAIRDAGLTVSHRLDGVGENYRDHAVVFVTFAGTPELQPEHVIPKVRLLARSSPGLDHPDLHVLMRPAIHVAGQPSRLPVSIHLLEHRSAGTVRLASADPDDAPIVGPGLLRDPADLRAMVDGLGFVDRLTSHPALAAFYGPLLDPATRGRWEEHVLSSFISYHHGVGTCRMGPDDDPGAVVDAGLRVHGIDNLRVADASVLPTVPHANTNLAAILVGEIAARELAAK